MLSLKAGAAGHARSRCVLGSAAAFGVHRFRFFGREAVSLLLVLPIALPGIITGIALNSAFQFVGLNLSLLTIVIGHATFCIVVVYNNVLARCGACPGRCTRLPPISARTASSPSGTITLPTLSTAIISGALLAFALSFDEVIVTTFTAGAQNTLPLWSRVADRRGACKPQRP